MDEALCHRGRFEQGMQSVRCRRADVSHEVRNTFLAKMLDEHSAPRSHKQPKTLWSQWVKEQYPTELEGSGDGGMGDEAETPPGSDEQEAEGNGAGAAS